MARGDVLYIELPSPGVGTGREQAGRRPAVVVQTDSTSGLSTIMIIPLTSQLSATRFAHTIQVAPSSANGLTQPSILLVFQLRAIDRRRVLNKIGELEQHYLAQLDNEIKNLLGLT